MGRKVVHHKNVKQARIFLNEQQYPLIRNLWWECRDLGERLEADKVWFEARKFSSSTREGSSVRLCLLYNILYPIVSFLSSEIPQLKGEIRKEGSYKRLLGAINPSGDRSVSDFVESLSYSTCHSISELEENQEPLFLYNESRHLFLRSCNEACLYCLEFKRSHCSELFKNS